MVGRSTLVAMSVSIGLRGRGLGRGRGKMKSILSLSGDCAATRYVRPPDFISLYLTTIKTSFRMKNPREIFSLKTFVERTIL